MAYVYINGKQTKEERHYKYILVQQLFGNTTLARKMRDWRYTKVIRTIEANIEGSM